MCSRRPSWSLDAAFKRESVPVEMVLLLHDGIWFACPEEIRCKRPKTLIKQVMENSVSLSVPLVVTLTDVKPICGVAEEIDMQCLPDHRVPKVEDDEQMTVFSSNVWVFPTERLNKHRSEKLLLLTVRLNEDTIIDLLPKKTWENSPRAGESRRP